MGEGPQSNEVDATPTLPQPNQPPVCTITNPTSVSTISGTYTITGTANDPNGTVERVEVRIDESAWVQVAGTTLWSYEWNTTTVSNGEHTIHALSYDGRRYSTEASVTVIVDNPVQEESVFEQAWFWVVVATAVILLLALLILIGRRMKRLEAEQPPEIEI